MSSSDNKEADLEAPATETAIGYVDGNFIHEKDLSAGNSWPARLQRLAGRFGIEQRGIERVPEDERTDTSMGKIGTLVSREELEEPTPAIVHRHI